MTRHSANVAFVERQEPNRQFSLHYERRSCIGTGHGAKEPRCSAKRNELRIGSNIGDNVIELLFLVPGWTVQQLNLGSLSYIIHTGRSYAHDGSVFPDSTAENLIGQGMRKVSYERFASVRSTLLGSLVANTCLCTDKSLQASSSKPRPS
jgi:hypothetical protein